MCTVLGERQRMMDGWMPTTTTVHTCVHQASRTRAMESLAAPLDRSSAGSRGLFGVAAPPDSSDIVLPTALTHSAADCASVVLKGQERESQ